MSTTTACQPFSQEEADKVRELYSLSLVYIMSLAAPKPAHAFYTSFLNGLRYTETIETAFAAVSFHKRGGRANILINPRNCKNLKLRSFAGLVVHEILHVMLGHVHDDSDFRRKHPKLFAIAADVVVNEMAKADGYRLPAGTGLVTDDPDFEVEPITLEVLTRKFGKAPRAKETLEYYCEWLRILSNADENPTYSQAELDDIIDELVESADHDDSVMAESDDMSPEQKQMMAIAVARSVQEAVENSGGIGGVPGLLQSHIRKVLLVLETRVQLDDLLINFYGGCGRSRKRLRKNRMNRREEPGLPGRVGSCSAGIVMDQSGSRSNTEVAYGFGVAKRVSGVYGLDTYCIEADDGILAAPWDIKDRDLSTSCTRIGAGGTNMGPGIRRFMEETASRGTFGVGGIIVISDGELGPDSMLKPDEIEIPLLYLFSRKRDPFKGRDYAGDCYYFDAESGYVERIPK